MTKYTCSRVCLRPGRTLLRDVAGILDGTIERSDAPRLPMRTLPNVPHDDDRIDQRHEPDNRAEDDEADRMLREEEDDPADRAGHPDQRHGEPHTQRTARMHRLIPATDPMRIEPGHRTPPFQSNARPCPGDITDPRGTWHGRHSRRSSRAKCPATGARPAWYPPRSQPTSRRACRSKSRAATQPARPASSTTRPRPDRAPALPPLARRAGQRRPAPYHRANRPTALFARPPAASQPSSPYKAACIARSSFFSSPISSRSGRPLELQLGCRGVHLLRSGPRSGRAGRSAGCRPSPGAMPRLRRDSRGPGPCRATVGGRTAEQFGGVGVLAGERGR